MERLRAALAAIKRILSKDADYRTTTAGLDYVPHLFHIECKEQDVNGNRDCRLCGSVQQGPIPWQRRTYST
ncbi:hypothetical protein ACK8OR_02030 [Jannaschia sp. KMU-145]|uniref:hypothetical protein n=1 Tax=Jannaschia halovivens TaxID=3388667 RepID=UPI00396B2ED9